MSPRTTKQQKPKSEPLETVAKDIRRESLEAILDEIRGIRAKKVDTAPHDPTTRIAWLTQRSIAIMAEDRKADAARSKQLERITKASVLAWFRQLDPAERAALIREAARIGQEASVLG